MGMMASTARSNDEMIDNLIKSRVLKTKQIEMAFRLVDRGNFLHPNEQTLRGYNDNAYRERFVDEHEYIHLSAPSIYAMALENFDIRPGMSFLNVGSGTGYFSTIVGFLLGESGLSHGIELFFQLIAHCEEIAKKFMRSEQASAYGWCYPEYFHGNGLQLANIRRYDRIYCGALVPPSRRSFFCDMLHINGVLIMPHRGKLIRINRVSETNFQVRNISSVLFNSFIQPDKTIESTDIPVETRVITPLFLDEICRLAIRRHLRELVTMENGRPVIRCRTMTSDGRFENNADPELVDERQDSSSCYLYRQNAESVPTLQLRAAGDAGARTAGDAPRQRQRTNGDADGDRPIRPVEYGHREALNEIVRVIDDRYARHRQAMQQRAGDVNNNNGERRGNLLQLQREEEQRRGDRRMLLDNDEFELIKNFHFERLVGDVFVADVENGQAGSDEEQDDEQSQHFDSSSESSDDDDDGRSRWQRLAMHLLPQPVRHQVANIIDDEDETGGNEPLVAGEIRFPQQERGVVLRIFDRSNQRRVDRSQLINDDENNDNEVARSSTIDPAASNYSLRAGKRTVATADEEEASTSKRVRAQSGGKKAVSMSSTDPVIEREGENDTAKILQDGIGHALDAAADENELEPNDADVSADQRDSDHADDVNDAASEFFDDEPVGSSMNSRLLERVRQIEQELMQFSNERDNLHIKNSSDDENVIANSTQSAQFDENITISSAQPSQSDESIGAISVQPSESDITTRPWESSHSEATHGSESDTELEESNRLEVERSASVARQTESLRDFARHFNAHVEALPISQRLIEFLQYKFNEYRFDVFC